MPIHRSVVRASAHVRAGIGLAAHLCPVSGKRVERHIGRLAGFVFLMASTTSLDRARRAAFRRKSFDNEG